MRRYMLDGNHIEFLARGDVRVSEAMIEARKNGSVIGTATPLAGEYLAGVQASASAARNYPIARVLIDKFRLWAFDFGAAEEYARLFAELRRKGITIGAIDLQSAAIALTLGNCTVVTTDSDFDRVPGLAVENWAE